jgi:hypothetical protein
VIEAILIECTLKGSGEDRIKIYSIDKDLNDKLNKDAKENDNTTANPCLCR